MPAEPLPVDPDANRRNAIALLPGEPHTDRLHCKAGDCRDWFVVTTEQRGELVVEVRPTPSDERASLRVVLFGHGAGAADHTDWDDLPPLRVRTAGERGAFFVLVEGTGGRLPFEIEATFRPESASGSAPAPRGMRARGQSSVRRRFPLSSHRDDPMFPVGKRGRVA